MTKNPEADKAKEDAKRENDQNKFKKRHEDKLADWESPEKLRKDGGDVHPETTVIPNTPQPENDPALKGTRYDPSTNGAKPE